jgi:hypothetical protein
MDVSLSAIGGTFSQTGLVWVIMALLIAVGSAFMLRRWLEV